MLCYSIIICSPELIESVSLGNLRTTIVEEFACFNICWVKTNNSSFGCSSKTFGSFYCSFITFIYGQ
uniref:Candidate secreted effector n=1 Tax=Meloidogyne incognita TaxID=6306 RepID=A0A914L3V6_MELIC